MQTTPHCSLLVLQTMAPFYEEIIDRWGVTTGQRSQMDQSLSALHSSVFHLFLFSSSSVLFLVPHFVLLTFACFFFSSFLFIFVCIMFSSCWFHLTCPLVSVLHHPPFIILGHPLYLFLLPHLSVAVRELSRPRPVITCRRTPSHIHTLSSDECLRLLSHDTGHQVLRGGPDVVAEVSLSRSDT